MKERNERDKLERVSSFRVSHTLGDELEAVARANNQNVQDLLRLAARALVRCHQEHGSIPLDMELRQRTWAPAVAAGATAAPVKPKDSAAAIADELHKSNAAVVATKKAEARRH